MIVLLLALNCAVINPHDSTVLYTLKENEIIVKWDEHHLMMSQKGASFVFFTYIPAQGYFVHVSSRTLGPFSGLLKPVIEEIEEGVIRVRKGNQTCLLSLASGAQVCNPLGRYLVNSAFCPVIYSDTVMRGVHAIMANGKIFETKVRIADSVRFSLQDFKFAGGKGYVHYYYEKNDASSSGRDSIVVLNCPESNVKKATSPEVAINFKSKRAGSGTDSLFVNGKFYTVVRKNSLAFNRAIMDNGYYAIDGTIYHTSPAGDTTRLFMDKKLIFSYREGEYIRGTTDPRILYIGKKNNEDYVHLIHLNKTLRQSFWSIKLSNNQQQYATEKSAKISIDGKDSPGFGLLHDEVADKFNWISVSGRTLYLHSYTCAK